MDISPYVAAALAAVCVPLFSWLMAAAICEAWKVTAQIEADAEVKKLEMLIENMKEDEQ